MIHKQLAKSLYITFSAYATYLSNNHSLAIQTKLNKTKQNIEINPYMYQQTRMYASSLSKNPFHSIHLNKTNNWIYPYMYQQTHMRHSSEKKPFHFIPSLQKKKKYRDQSIYVPANAYVFSLSKIYFISFTSKKTKHRDQSIYVPANVYVCIISQQKSISFHSLEQNK